jgi:hypothetical protein
MKKPVNKVAFVLWIAAALFALEEAWTLYGTYETAARMRASDQIYLSPDGIWAIIRSVFLSIAMLTGIGVLIELVDQIRWVVGRASEKP